MSGGWVAGLIGLGLGLSLAILIGLGLGPELVRSGWHILYNSAPRRQSVRERKPNHHSNRDTSTKLYSV